jgi:hypothetical protein
MSMITLAQSNRIIEAIFARGRELGCRPLSVVIVEPGAKVKAFQKEDGSAMMRFEMAFGKAYAALALGRSSSLVRVRTEERPLFMQYLIHASDDQILSGRRRHADPRPGRRGDRRGRRHGRHPGARRGAGRPRYPRRRLQDRRGLREYGNHSAAAKLEKTFNRKERKVRKEYKEKFLALIEVQYLAASPNLIYKSFLFCVLAFLR